MSKTASGIAKGIAIMMMLMHHLFSTQSRINANGHGQEVVFAPFPAGQVFTFSQCMKACVAVFVFITAYGIYKSISARMQGQAGQNVSASVASRYSCGHIVKLLMNFWVVYIPFALLGFAVSDHTMISVYGVDGPFFGVAYFFADFLGLASMFGTPMLNDTWWYMSLALLLILVVPVLSLLARKIGGVVLFGLSIALPLLSGFDMLSDFWNYLPTAALGIMFAQYDLFPKLDFGARSPWHFVLLFVVYTALLLVFIRARKDVTYVFFLNVVCALLVCQIARVIERAPVVSSVLGFLGKHSMNIFLLHTFIYSIYFGQFIFSFKYFLLIFAVLLGVSLVCSMALEGLKKLTRYDQLCARVVKSIEGWKIFAADESAPSA